MNPITGLALIFFALFIGGCAMVLIGLGLTTKVAVVSCGIVLAFGSARILGGMLR